MITNEEMCKGAEAVEKYWGDLMPMMAMEEAAEFSQAVSKLERIRKRLDECQSEDIDPDDFDEFIEARRHLSEEIGDLMISVKAIQYTFTISDSSILHRIEEKLSKKYK